MTVARLGLATALLLNGNVLMVGGINAASAEIYDSVSGTFTATGSMSVARSYETATLLGDGRVLVTGGLGLFNGLLASAEVYE
jgi:hypothetical protein